MECYIQSDQNNKICAKLTSELHDFLVRSMSRLDRLIQYVDALDRRSQLLIDTVDDSAKILEKIEFLTEKTVKLDNEISYLTRLVENNADILNLIREEKIMVERDSLVLKELKLKPIRCNSKKNYKKKSSYRLSSFNIIPIVKSGVDTHLGNDSGDFLNKHVTGHVDHDGNIDSTVESDFDGSYISNNENIDISTKPIDFESNDIFNSADINDHMKNFILNKKISVSGNEHMKLALNGNNFHMNSGRKLEKRKLMDTNKLFAETINSHRLQRNMQNFDNLLILKTDNDFSREVDKNMSLTKNVDSKEKIPASYSKENIPASSNSCSYCKNLNLKSFPNDYDNSMKTSHLSPVNESNHNSDITDDTIKYNPMFRSPFKTPIKLAAKSNNQAESVLRNDGLLKILELNESDTNIFNHGTYNTDVNIPSPIDSKLTTDSLSSYNHSIKPKLRSSHNNYATSTFSNHYDFNNLESFNEHSTITSYDNQNTVVKPRNRSNSLPEPTTSTIFSTYGPMTSSNIFSQYESENLRNTRLQHFISQRDLQSEDIKPTDFYRDSLMNETVIQDIDQVSIFSDEDDVITNNVEQEEFDFSKFLRASRQNLAEGFPSIKKASLFDSIASKPTITVASSSRFQNPGKSIKLSTATVQPTLAIFDTGIKSTSSPAKNDPTHIWNDFISRNKSSSENFKVSVPKSPKALLIDIFQFNTPKKKQSKSADRRNSATSSINIWANNFFQVAPTNEPQTPEKIRELKAKQTTKPISVENDNLNKRKPMRIPGSQSRLIVGSANTKILHGESSLFTQPIVSKVKHSSLHEALSQSIM